MIPEKLKEGDEIKVFSPAETLANISKEVVDEAIKKFKMIGLKVTFSKYAREKDEFDSSSVQSRISDLHEAFIDKNIKAIISTIGGLNSNQLLSYIDYKLVKANPKVLCGYSEMTTLQNAIYKKTGLVTYSGPHFSSFGMVKGFEYTLEYFKKCLMSKRSFEVVPAEAWSDDSWYLDQNKRTFVKNEGYFIINHGVADGKIIGGNLNTFNLLQGTQYMPKLSNTILFLEDDDASSAGVFDRDLQSLIHQPGFEKVKGLVIARFQKGSGISREKLYKIIKTKKELDNIPIIADVDCGHTTPQITFPIGGTCSIKAEKSSAIIKILKH